MNQNPYNLSANHVTLYCCQFVTLYSIEDPIDRASRTRVDGAHLKQKHALPPLLPGARIAVGAVRCSSVPTHACTASCPSACKRRAQMVRISCFAYVFVCIQSDVASDAVLVFNAVGHEEALRPAGVRVADAHNRGRTPRVVVR